jgi:hypothetical protein
MTNWIDKTGNPQPSAVDKLKELLKISNRLMLVHFHELERIKQSKKGVPLYNGYVINLYTHYIENGLSKHQI